jgi:hypothetical protein
MSGLILTAIGLAGIGTGIYLQHSGRTKLKSIAEEYNATQSLSQYNDSRRPYLGLALTGNGVGLRLTF